MLQEFKDLLRDRFPELVGPPFLLACSGGIDSMVLADLCLKTELRFSMAHCNFKLRGEESDADEAFVSEWAAKNNIPIHLAHFETKETADKEKMSVQMAARDLRYTWFGELKQSEGYEYVVTAHHLDDSLETFLINLSRGTGLEGLSGIPEKNNRVYRPLLRFSRTEIESYAAMNDLQWREDQSNQDIKYLRNKIRHQIVPELKELHPNFLKNFAKTQQYLADTEGLLQFYGDKLKKKLFREEKGVIKISLERLERLKPLQAHMYLLFKSYGFTNWDNLIDLLDATSGKELRSKSYRLLKDREHLLLKAIELNPKESFEIEAMASEIKNPLKLSLEEVKAISETSKRILYVDKETLNPILEVRKWRKGDYFYPLGMSGKKKISKFFKDEKIDQISKEEQWLLCSGDEIVWVIGRRADERFKVKKHSRDILKITLLE